MAPSVARVVPAIPSFTVDRGFRYAIPSELSDRVSVGTAVRVPLSGRRVRGFVVDLEEADTAGLRDIAQVSGKVPIFDVAHLESLRWLARHYIAPLAVALERAAPPNNPTAGPTRIETPSIDVEGPVPRIWLSGETEHTVWLTPRPDVTVVTALAAHEVQRGRSLVLIAATEPEVMSLSRAVEGAAGVGPLTVHGGLTDREVTAAWSTARRHPSFVVGTPRVAGWPVKDVGTAMIIQEGRRAMKDRQTPTIGVRDLLLRRSTAEGFRVVFAGPTPSVESISLGTAVLRRPGRLWPLVEIVDRSEDAEGGGLFTTTAKRAITAVTRAGGNVFVFAHRRGYAAAVRCVRCRTLRTCSQCGSRPDPGSNCTRCGATLGPCADCGHDRFEPLGAGVGRVVEELGRLLGRDGVGAYPSGARVEVGTERDLADLPRFPLVVFTDVDGMLYGANYRAAEETLRIGARLADAVKPGSGHRLLVQTAEPRHSIVDALRRADPVPALQRELAARAAFGYPPRGELVVVEIRGDIDAARLTAELTSHADAGEVLGPAEHRSGTRWLVQGKSLDGFKVRIRPRIQAWRDSGLTVRIDADPIDL